MNPNIWHILPARQFVTQGVCVHLRHTDGRAELVFHPLLFHFLSLVSQDHRAKATKEKGLWLHPQITNSRGCPCFPCHTPGSRELLYGCQTIAKESVFWSHLESALFLSCSSQNSTACPFCPNAYSTRFLIRFMLVLAHMDVSSLCNIPCCCTLMATLSILPPTSFPGPCAPSSLSCVYLSLPWIETTVCLRT